MAKTYYIFRHGLTLQVKNGESYGLKILSAPIIKEGEGPIARMGEYLKYKNTDYNISSPFKRCRQTVGIISKISKKEFVFDNKLSEYFLETKGMVIRRVKKLLSEIDKKGYEEVAICTHGAIISILIDQIISSEDAVKTYDIFHYPDPGILVVIDNKNISEINFNQ